MSGLSCKIILSLLLSCSALAQNFYMRGRTAVVFQDSTDGPRGTKVRGQGEVLKARWEGDRFNASCVQSATDTNIELNR